MRKLHKILFLLVLIGSLVGCNNQPNVKDNNDVDQDIYIDENGSN